MIIGQQCSSSSGGSGCAGDEEPCRSLVCDASGIIIAEMAYRCIVCSHISDSIADGQQHYQRSHMTDSCNQRLDGGGDGRRRDQPAQALPLAVGGSAEPQEPGDASGGDFDADANFSDPEDDWAAQISAHYPSVKSGKSAINRVDQTQQQPQQPQQQQSKGGFVTCSVCNMTKFYQSVQRRYGQFTCMGCAKFFARFLLKPKKYSCPQLGSCPLDVSPRCKACLLLACNQTYIIDDRRMAIVNANRPVRGPTAPVGTSPAATVAAARPPVPLSSVSRSPRASMSSAAGAAAVASKKSLSPSPATSSTSTITSSSWCCRKCSGCLADDCGSCLFCRDKPKFGGGNTLKKKCMQRRCLSASDAGSGVDQPLQPLLIQPTA